MSKDEKKRAAAIYCRISSDPRETGLGVARQEEDCRANAKRLGWDVLDVFVDNDTSAYSGKPRREYLRMLDALRKGEATAVVAWHPDRLHRSPRELEDFIDLIDETRAAVATVQAGEYDLSTPAGRMAARIVGAVARGESEHKSARIRRKHEELAKNGKVSGGGTRPFGYEADRRTIRKDEAKLVREAARRALAGESLRSIASDFAARGIVGPHNGKPLTITGLRRMLASGRIAGLREHGTRRKDGERVEYPAEWPAIIDRETHEGLRALLLDPGRRRTPPGPPRRYLLTGGLAVCGECSMPLVARPKGGRALCGSCSSTRLRCGACGRANLYAVASLATCRDCGAKGKPTCADCGKKKTTVVVGEGPRAYTCATGPGFVGCGKIRRVAEPVDETVAEHLFVSLENGALAKLTDRKSLERTRNAEAAKLAEDIGWCQARLQMLAARFANGDFSTMEWDAMKETLSKRIAANTKRLARSPSVTALPKLPRSPSALRAEWDRQGIEWRRAVVAAFVEKVVVLRADKGKNTFDELKIDVRMRA